MCLDASAPVLPSKRKLDPSSSSASPQPRKLPAAMIQFLVRIGSGSRVFRARPSDTIADLHHRIHSLTGIPPSHQRLVFGGRPLYEDLTLAACGILDDSCLHLTGRLLSTSSPRAWTIANDLLSWVRSSWTAPAHPKARHDPASLVRMFLRIAGQCGERVAEHLQVFLYSGAAAALVTLYLTPPPGNPALYRAHAEKCVLMFAQPEDGVVPRSVEPHCVPLLLEFCRLLSASAGKEDRLYLTCRRRLGSLLESSGVLYDSSYFAYPWSLNLIKELLPYAVELGGLLRERLLKWLEEKLSLAPMGSHCDALVEFSSFVNPLRRAIFAKLDECVPGSSGNALEGECWFLPFRRVFTELLDVVDRCLKMVEDDFLVAGGGRLNEGQSLAWSFFLVVLTELDRISKILAGEGEQLYKVLMERRVALNALLGKAKRNPAFQWFLKFQDVTDFEARRNLVLMLFPEEKEDYDDLHEMLIDRSNLLAESLEYITSADPVNLRNHILMEFKNEDATGPGVLREWFFLLGKALFDPTKVLFSPCPHDRRRFFPNPTSVVDPLHLKYFGFAGRITALALRHRVPIGVVFDRVFFQQLAGKPLSLDDIQDADPVFYMSCKRFLEMDAETLDSGVGLTFSREVEELGVRRLVELCPGGSQISVNSTNRQDYIDLLIRSHFVTSTSQQVAQFAQGFADIISSLDYQQSFFGALKLEDFDQMLGGGGDICVDDWKKHTEYKGYRKKDRQINWFWKVVAEMSVEQRRILMAFWTSLRYLPLEGFRGLPSKLYIHRSSSSSDHLPTSHTCFYQLCLPAYTSVKIMRERLHLVTQEHVGSSFGRW